jgi:hypothetical protein
MITKKDKNRDQQSIDPGKNDSPLAKLDKKNPFRVPANYFDELPGRIMAKRRHTGKTSVIEGLMPFFSHPKYQLALVVGSLALVFSVLFIYNPWKADVSDQFLSNITLDDLLRESPEIIAEMENYLFIEILIADQTGEIIYSTGKSLEKDSSLSEEDLINYLKEEEISTELIYEL